MYLTNHNESCFMMFQTCRRWNRFGVWTSSWNDSWNFGVCGIYALIRKKPSKGYSMIRYDAIESYRVHTSTSTLKISKACGVVSCSGCQSCFSHVSATPRRTCRWDILTHLFVKRMKTSRRLPEPLQWVVLRNSERDIERLILTHFNYIIIFLS